MRFHSFLKKMRWAPVFALVCCGALTVVHSASTQELDGDPIPNVEATPKPKKVWDVGTPIDTGTAKVTAGAGADGGAQVTIDWNQTAQVSVEGAKDSDHWKDGDQEGTAADGITYQWSGQGTFATPNAASSQWTPPTLPSDNASFTYKLFCTIDDTPTPVGEGEGGTRDDDAPEHLMVEVKVTRKKWDVGSAIQLGGPITSDVTPQPSLQGGPKLYVEQGQQVHLTIPTATDKDHWVYRDTEGTEADEVNYTWSGANNLSSTKGQSVTWTAPSLPGQVGSAEVPLTCTVDDKPTPIDTANGETGTRDDDAKKSTITLVVVRKMWAPNKGIGFHPQLDAQGQFDKYNPTWVHDGQVVSPSVSATTNKASAMPGQHIVCALSEAHDWDSWTKGDMAGAANADLVEDSPLSYRWTATHGQFLVGQGEDAHLADHADTREAVWVAPDDIQNDTNVTLTCTVDDPAGDRVNAPLEGGSRNDGVLVRTVSVKIMQMEVTFKDQLARACAGGVAVDGVHDFTITGTAKLPDGAVPPTGTEFKLVFEGNKGHNYGDGREKKTAKFVTIDANGNQKLVEELMVQTDLNGQFSVKVLSSDIISSDIKIKVKSVSGDGNETEVGEKGCDFDEAVGIRRFPNQYNPDEDEDLGWLFNTRWLTPSVETTAKVYMKFMVNPSLGDVNGNWREVNGHEMFFKVDSVDMRDGGTPGDLSDFVILVPTEDNGATVHVTSPGVNGAAGGAATSVIRAGERVSEAEMIWLIAYDQSQWEE